MGGYLRAGATEPVVGRATPTRSARRITTRARRALVDELAVLPAGQRAVLIAMANGRSPAAVARGYGVHAVVVDELLDAARRAIRVTVADRSPPFNSAQPDELRYPATMKGLLAMTSDKITCAEPGCSRSVKGGSPRRRDLAPYCPVHRRAHGTAAPGGSPSSPLGSPTSRDRATFARLLESDTPGRATIEEVTPGVAVLLLERNTSNRPIAKDRVELYARDMVAGAWRINNQGIALGADGRLYDGQHRLMAVLRAGLPVKMAIVRGLEPEARTTIDQGRVRSIGDNLKLMDGFPHGRRVVAWLRAAEALTPRRAKQLSHAMVVEMMACYGTSIAWLLDNGPKARPFNHAPVLGTLLFAHHRAAKVVASFTAGYVTGADLPKTSPILMLRNDLASGKSRVPARDLSLKVLHAIVAFARDEVPTAITANEDTLALFEATFPEAPADPAASVGASPAPRRAVSSARLPVAREARC